MDTPHTKLTPVVEGDRIDSIDVLRGVAVLGILVINIVSYGQPGVTLNDPIIFDGGDRRDIATWFAAHVLFEQKFFSMFSMLFGAGLILMAQRAEARGVRFGGVYYRRLLWLAVIGFVHAYLIWFGDILATYAVCGLILYPLRRRSPRALILLGTALIFVSPAIWYWMGRSIEAQRAEAAAVLELSAAGREVSAEQQGTLKAWRETQAMLLPPPEELDRQVDAMRGNYAEILAEQVPQAATEQFFALITYGLWRVLGLMLIGMALMKLDVLSGNRPPVFYRRAVAIGYGFGVPLSILSALVLMALDFDFIRVLKGANIFNYVASLFVALGHVGLAMLFCQSRALPGLRARLAAVGRAALTNYLLHSVVFTAIFYGFGLGLFGRFSRFALMGFVAPMWLFQLYASSRWLAAYRFGPVEWLWRSLTYWRPQPMRRPRSAP